MADLPYPDSATEDAAALLRRGDFAGAARAHRNHPTHPAHALRTAVVSALVRQRAPELAAPVVDQIMRAVDLAEVAAEDRAAICEVVAEADDLDLARARLDRICRDWSLSPLGYRARIEERAGHLDRARALACDSVAEDGLSIASVGLVVHLRSGLQLPARLGELAGPDHLRAMCYRLWAERALIEGDTDGALATISQADEVAQRLDIELANVIDIADEAGAIEMTLALIDVQSERLASTRSDRAQVLAAAAAVGRRLNAELDILEQDRSRTNVATTAERMAQLLEGPVDRSLRTLETAEPSDSATRCPTGAEPSRAEAVSARRAELAALAEEMARQGPIPIPFDLDRFRAQHSDGLVADWYGAEALRVGMNERRDELRSHIDQAIRGWVRAGEMSTLAFSDELIPRPGQSFPTRFWEIVAWIRAGDTGDDDPDASALLKSRAITRAGVVLDDDVRFRDLACRYFAASLDCAHRSKLLGRARIALFNLAWGLQRTRRLAEAIVGYTLVCELPGFGPGLRSVSLGHLADIASVQGNRDLAVRMATRAIEMIDRDHDVATGQTAWFLAITCARVGLQAEAQRVFDQYPPQDWRIGADFEARLVRSFLASDADLDETEQLIGQARTQDNDDHWELALEARSRALLAHGRARDVIELLGPDPTAQESPVIASLRIDALGSTDHKADLVRAIAARARQRRTGTVRPRALLTVLGTTRSDLDRDLSRLVERADEERHRLEAIAHIHRTLMHDVASPMTILSAAGTLELNESTIAAAIAQLRPLALALTDVESVLSEPRSLQAVAIGPLVEMVIAAAGGLAQRKQIALTASIEPGLVGYGDEHLLERCLSNVVSNAIKFTPAQGFVTVTADRRDEVIRLEVLDSGPGFAPHDLEVVGQQLGTLSARPTGGEASHGLGLVATAEMCAAQQIQLEFSNHPSLGASCKMKIRPLVHA